MISPKIVSLVVSLPLIAAGVSIAGCATASSSHLATTGGNKDSVVIDRAYGKEPGYESLSPSELLDRSLSHPGMRGVLYGTIISSGASSSNGSTGGAPRIVTDFVFKVTESVGFSHDPVPAGTQVTLRVPGGTVNGITETVEDAPVLHSGENLLVYAQGWNAGSTSYSSTPLVVNSAENVAPVDNGQVSWAGGVFPLGTFVDHLSAHPASS